MSEPKHISPTELVNVLNTMLAPLRAELEAFKARQREQESDHYETRKILFALHERLDEGTK